MKKKLVIKSSWCKKCGICVAYCPAKILDLDEKGVFVKEKGRCIACGQCEQRCPDYAIYIKKV